MISKRNSCAISFLLRMSENANYIYIHIYTANCESLSKTYNRRYQENVLDESFMDRIKLDTFESIVHYSTLC